MTNRKTVNQARREFQAKYGTRTVSVVSLLARGLTTEQVATRTGTPVTSVRTFKANMTRNAYAPFVSVSARGVSGRIVSSR